MKFTDVKILLIVLMPVFLFCRCSKERTSVLMADSEMSRYPELYKFDHGHRLFFGYTQGLGGCAFLKMYKATGDKKYYDYVYSWGDSIVGEDGSIYKYDMSKYNLDFINSGKVLFDLYEISHKKKFRMAMDTLLEQIKGQPRVAEGGFWHKKIYEHQMWLDGLYMCSPFLSEYGSKFNRPDLIDEAITQLLVATEHTYDENKGLFYHGWDESRSQAWADSITGTSPNFWGRSMGWLAMALVDNLDYIPETNPRRLKIIALVKTVADGMAKYQNKTGLWYQVIDKGDKKGNYPEASVSSMMMYFYAKAVNKGYLDAVYKKYAEKAYEGIMKNLIKKNDDGTITMINCCKVAGLGGHPYRNGSFDYYVHEKITENDGKATAPFIMGCIELSK